MTDADAASGRTVVVAVAANLLVALAKAAAAVMTGSAALAAETAHSLADTGNELLLYVGLRAGARPGDERHPFGHGQARYFWSLLAGIGLFVVGGIYAIFDGVQALRHPQPLSDVATGVVVLLISAVLEGASWWRARLTLREGATARRLRFAEFVATTSDPAPRTVYFEDTAALIGIALALAALGLHALTGSALWDALASLAIGVLLIVIALRLVFYDAGFLIDQSAPADIREDLRTQVEREPWVQEVAELSAVFIGPRRLLVLVHVVPTENTHLTERIDALRSRLLALPAVSAVEITPVSRSG